MLRAQLASGELITLAILTRQEINVHRRNDTFYCPVCKSPLIIKAGARMIPHFAHHSKSSCPSGHGGESHFHKKGKIRLYQWLVSQQLHVELEPYLKEIKQQPDLLLTIRHKKIAIEFQCARVSIHQIVKRNKGYLSAGFIPIWILGANRLERQGKYHLKLEQFTQQFIHQFSSGLPQRLFYFCPNSLQLLIYQDIFLTHTKRAIGNLSFHKLDHITFTGLFNKNPMLKIHLYERWKEEKVKFRTAYRKEGYGKDQAWRKWLYFHNTHLEHLPSIIYLPILNQHLMKTPPWDWQSRLYIEIIHPLPLGGVVSLGKCKYLLRTDIYKQHQYPLIQSDIHPVDQYLQLLAELNILHKKTPNEFIKVNDAHFYKHIEQAIEGDQMMMNELILKN